MRRGSLYLLVLISALVGASPAGAQAPTATPCVSGTPALAFDGVPSTLITGRINEFSFAPVTGAVSTPGDKVFVTLTIGSRKASNSIFWMDDTDRWRFRLGDRKALFTGSFLETSPTGAVCTRTISKSIKHKQRIFFPTRCTNAGRIRPRSVIVACGDGNLRLRSMKWRNWNQRVARGRGTALANDCVPNCAAGHLIPYRVKARLSVPRRCANRGRYFYTRMVYRFNGRRGTASFPCSSLKS